MVKLQKPNPKTLQMDLNKSKQFKSLKKEKLTELKTGITASNKKAKKEKLKLIEKAIINEQPAELKKRNTTSDHKAKKEKLKLIEKGSNKQPTKVSSKSQKHVDKNNEVVKPVVQEDNAIFTMVDKKHKKKTVEAKDEVVVSVKETKVKKKKEKKSEKKISQEIVPTKDQVAVKSKSQKLEKNGNKKKGKQSEDDDQQVSAVSPKVKKYKKNKKKQPIAGKSEKKSATVVQNVIEVMPFDEKKFNAIVNVDNIKKIAKAFKQLVEKEVKEKKNTMFEDYRYLLNVCCFKIPNCPRRVVKLKLANSLVDPKEDDVVIVVPDLQRGAKVDYEPTIQHYEDLFRENGITDLKIVPFNQLRQECTTFEAKRKFASTYDYFLCDGRIVSHVASFGGTSFQRTRTTFHSVRLNHTKTLKREVDKSLKRTCYRQLEKGDTISIPVGNHRFTIDQLAENIKLVVDQLKTLYPGGYGNIRNMHVKIDIVGTSSLPLYASLTKAPAETPSVLGMREQRMLKLKKEANEVLSHFNMSKTGEFVKLDKAQTERKRKIMEARKALLTEGLPDEIGGDGENVDEEFLPKKPRKSQKVTAKVRGENNAENEEAASDEDDEDSDEEVREHDDDDDNEDDDADDDDASANEDINEDDDDDDDDKDIETNSENDAE